MQGFTNINDALKKLSSNVNGGQLNESSMPSGIPAGVVASATRLKPDQDSLAGKAFVYADGEMAGRQEVVEYTIEQNGRYSVIFNSGVQMFVDELNLKMIQAEDYIQKIKRTDGIGYDDEEDIDNIRPSRVNRANGVPPTTEAATQVLPPPPLSEAEFKKSIGLEYDDAPPQRVPTQSQQQVKTTPVTELLRKLKNEPIEVDIKLNLNIPNKDVFKMLVENFDGAEEEIMEYLFAGENLRTLKKQCEVGIKEFYGVVKTPVEHTETVVN